MTLLPATLDWDWDWESGVAEWTLELLVLWAVTGAGPCPLFFLGREVQRSNKQQSTVHYLHAYLPTYQLRTAGAGQARAGPGPNPGWKRAPFPMGISRTPNPTWPALAKVLPLRDGNGDSWATRRTRTAAGRPASWLAEGRGRWLHEDLCNGQLLRDPMHPIKYQQDWEARGVRGLEGWTGWKGCISHELSQPPPSSLLGDENVGLVG